MATATQRWKEPEPSQAVINARIEVAQMAGLDPWLGLIDAAPKPVLQPNGTTWRTPRWNPEAGSWELVPYEEKRYPRPAGQ